MGITTRTSSARSAALLAALLTVPALADPARAAAEAPLTREESRLESAVPQEILRRGGFDGEGAGFAAALARARTPRQAERLTADTGRRLWRHAVDRAQGRGTVRAGDLPRDDDRPLYWARLDLTRTLHRWQPPFPLSERRRADLLASLERTSRGQDSIGFPAGRGVKRVLVTGFDPFQLDDDIRRSNPSGASALALDGTTVNTPSGPARIEATVFPVRWDDFARGTVERTLLPHFRPGPRRADLFTTISQGRPGRFDVERTNGAWRGSGTDNEGLRRGPAPVPVRQHPQPQWTRTTLPYAVLTSTTTGPYPVHDNTSVTEVPAGSTTPVERPDGPTPGSAARAGGGGDYLSNEIAYRATLLRDVMRLRVPGGHLHTPVLRFADGNGPAGGRVTDPDFERNRRAIVAQVRSLIGVAAGTVHRP
ncbi:pyroglutamyl peptidase [Streptomyces sp. AV19]|uniref:pyroglutamyl peptidase n=1 Tax=Streptomyces sp. AV19 TaxID=2793068 RepID=UPI0018FEDF06|nr:pyroglutamyl peptidase [Streptomyces sp. AV19]MBH1933343.1 pyroglutamyl peptidase [Streptomyces sp. AV19]MDG4531954.1 pyroglutamyl peptidase [Streptomyces sp. AV19]